MFRTILLGSIAGVALVSTAAAGEIVFKDKTNGGGKVVGRMSDQPVILLAGKHSPVEDEKACSLILCNVRPGTYIRVFDDPRADPRDGWCTIYVKRFVPQYVIKTFHHAYDDDVVSVRCFVDAKDGIDGEVSRVEISRAR